MKLFTRESGDVTRNAEMNLAGRTHYVDPDTRRYFHSRITASNDTCGGLLFYIVESCAADYQNTRRGFRPVVFDLFGEVIFGPNLETLFRTTEQARKAAYAFINSVDAVAVANAAIDRQERENAHEIANARAQVQAVAALAKAGQDEEIRAMDASL